VATGASTCFGTACLTAPTGAGTDPPLRGAHVGVCTARGSCGLCGDGTEVRTTTVVGPRAGPGNRAEEAVDERCEYMRYAASAMDEGAPEGETCLGESWTEQPGDLGVMGHVNVS